VQDVLAASNGLRTIFEPLHPDAIPGAADFAHVFREAEDNDPQLSEYLSKYFHGNCHSLWADYRVRGDLLFSGQGGRYLVRHLSRAYKKFLKYRSQRKFEKRIIKLIRANMMLSWLKQEFEPRIVYMLRHPAAVALSQMNSPRMWKPQERLTRYRSDNRILDGLNDGARRLLSHDLSDPEAVTLSWCIENKIAIRQAASSNICVVFYENLLTRGMSEWHRILDALELLVVPDDDLIARPSQQAWGAQAADRKLVGRYAAWMSRIDEETAAQIQGVLDATDTGLYSVDQALPQMDV
jgi:hypothetical protein